MDGVVEYIHQVPFAGLMLVVTAGFLLGRIRWKGVSLGPAGGTVAVGLVGGHLGLDVPSLYGGVLPTMTIGLFGFCLFIYSVGFEAGPRLLSSLRGRRGWRLFTIGVLVNVVAAGTAVGAARLLSLDGSTAAGILAGALTSAPTYAAAAEVAPDTTHLSVAFAVTYPVGLLGVVLVIQVLPRLLRTRGGTETGGPVVRPSRPPALRPEHGSPEVTRTFAVEHDAAAGKPLRELDLTHRTGCVIQRIRRGADLLMPTAETILRQGDRLAVTGRVDELQTFEEVVGQETYDAKLGESSPGRRVQIMRGSAAGRPLAELDLPGRYGVVVTRIESGGMLLEPTADTVLHRTDVIELVGEEADVRRAARELGRIEPSTTHTDIAIYAGGIVLGVLLGSVSLAPLGVDFSLGLAGGLLIAGVVLGRFRQIGPFSAHVPTSARQLVRDLGILLFVAETGLGAGSRLTEVGPVLWPSLVAAASVLVLSLASSLFVARRVLKLDPMDALGSVCGGMTSSAALTVLERVTRTHEPSASFAAAYAIASVLVTIAGQIVVGLV